MGLFAFEPRVCPSFCATVRVRARGPRLTTTPRRSRRELAEKIAKAIKKADEAQRKAAEKAAKREKEALEDRTEAQQEAREKAYKQEREAAHRAVEAAHDSQLDAQALDLMEDAVEDYVKKIHKPAEKQVGTPARQGHGRADDAHRRALAQAIRAMRPQAPGDLILPGAQPVVKRVIAAELAGRGAARAQGDPGRQSASSIPTTTTA